MSEHCAAAAPKPEPDRELTAIRTLIQEQDVSRDTSAASSGASSPLRSAARLPRLTSAEPETSAAPVAPQEGGAARRRLRHLLSKATRSVISYRPERKKILLTSLVLLLILQPMWIVVPTLLCAIALAIAYHNMGSDGFWQRVVTLFRHWETRQPDKARVARLRAALWARKWDRLLAKLPGDWALHWRAPDLKAIAAAEAKHDAALTDRLTRLHQDATI